MNIIELEDRKYPDSICEYQKAHDGVIDYLYNHGGVDENGYVWTYSQKVNVLLCRLDKDGTRTVEMESDLFSPERMANLSGSESFITPRMAMMKEKFDRERDEKISQMFSDLFD